MCRYSGNILTKTLKYHDFAPVNLNRQRASNIAMLGMEMLKSGNIISADDMKPEYLRKSQAEREKDVDKTDAAL